MKISFLIVMVLGYALILGGCETLTSGIFPSETSIMEEENGQTPESDTVTEFEEGVRENGSSAAQANASEEKTGKSSTNVAATKGKSVKSSSLKEDRANTVAKGTVSSPGKADAKKGMASSEESSTRVSQISTRKSQDPKAAPKTAVAKRAEANRADTQTAATKQAGAQAESETVAARQAAAQAEEEKMAAAQAEAMEQDEQADGQPVAAKQTKIKKQAIVKAPPSKFMEKVIPELETVYFEFDQSRIQQHFKAIIEKNLAWLRQNPDVKVQLEGHADERGTNQYNLALGAQRSKSILNFMISLGANPEQFTIISFGEERPAMVDCTIDTCYQRNRRVEFTRQ